MTATQNQNNLKSSKLVLSLDTRLGKGFDCVFFFQQKQSCKNFAKGRKPLLDVRRGNGLK